MPSQSGIDIERIRNADRELRQAERAQAAKSAEDQTPSELASGNEVVQDDRGWYNGDWYR